jgi:hypothetical protein
MSSIAIDSSGNIIAAGRFTAPLVINDTLTINYSNGWDPFLAKFDSSGNFIWEKHFSGENSNHIPGGIETDNENNIYLIGNTDGDLYFESQLVSVTGSTNLFIAKFDTDGNLVWLKQGSGPGTYRISGSCIYNQFLYCTGWFSDTLTVDNITITSAGGNEFFVLKFNMAGMLIDAFHDGYYSSNQPTLVVYENYIYIICLYNGTTIIGANNLPAYGVQDIFIAKYSDHGIFQWVRTFGSSDYDNAIMIINNGRIFVYGYFMNELCLGTDTLTSIGNRDLFIASFDTSGNYLNSKYIGGSKGDEFFQSIDYDSFGNIFLSGIYCDTAYFSDTVLISEGGDDGFIAEYDQSFNQKLLFPLKDIGACHPSGICIDKMNYLYVCGKFGSPYLNVLDTTLQGYYNYNSFLVKIWHNDVLPFDTTGIIEPLSSNSDLFVFPNPTTGKFTIRTNRQPEVCIYNSIGGLIIKKQINSNTSKEFDLSGQPAGVYFFKAICRDKVDMKKLIRL